MQIKPQQLLNRLQQHAVPVIWIAGDEPLLVQEAGDSAREYARQQQYSEREVLDVGPAFDWSTLLQAANSMSLFAEKKLLDLRLPSVKLDNQAKDVLKAYVDKPGTDNLLLITSPKVDKAMTAAKWFKAIEGRGYFVPVWPVTAQQLPQWISERLARHGLSADARALHLLTERVEGNLLAAAQEVEKLSLLYQSRELDAEMIMQSVADNARYNVFALLDAAVAGEGARALKILNHLQGEGAEPLQLLNLLCREVRNLVRMREKVEQGQNINGVMQAERVWSNRTRIIGHALHSHSVHSLSQLLRDARLVDQAVKGLLDNNPWDELASLLLHLAGSRLRLYA